MVLNMCYNELSNLIYFKTFRTKFMIFILFKDDDWW